MSSTVQVDLAERSYDILIGTGRLSELGSACAALGLGARCLVVSDDRVWAEHGAACSAALSGAGFDVSQAIVPHGESSKSQEQLFALYIEALAAGLDRKAFMVALGGGVVGDLAGYAAASYLRGVDYVQVPTSVVAMVDSAVGGKTGINLPEGKNLIGAFHQPRLVVADLELLKTLPEREYLSGLAEVVKYGVIRDADLFATLEAKADSVRDVDLPLMGEIVQRSCDIKADVVARDEREGGLRAILNFGHTVGHAIEKLSNYDEYLHGEAISIGMVYAARLSCREKGLSESEAARLTGLLDRFGLPTAKPALEWPALREVISVDKKTRGSVPKFVLANAIGEVEFGCAVEEEVLEAVWEEME